MKLRHLNGHAALHALQLPTAPPRMDDVARELSRRSQRLERGGKLIRRGVQPKVGDDAGIQQSGRPGQAPAAVGADHDRHELAGRNGGRLTRGRTTEVAEKPAAQDTGSEAAVPATPHRHQRRNRPGSLFSGRHAWRHIGRWWQRASRMSVRKYWNMLIEAQRFARRLTTSLPTICRKSRETCAWRPRRASRTRCSRRLLSLSRRNIRMSTSKSLSPNALSTRSPRASTSPFGSASWRIRRWWRAGF